jgi:hypothetical protein
MRFSNGQLRLLSDYSNDISKALLVSLMIQIVLDKEMSTILKAVVSVPAMILAGIFLFLALKWRKKL